MEQTDTDAAVMPRCSSYIRAVPTKHPYNLKREKLESDRFQIRLSICSTFLHAAFSATF